MGKKKNKKSKDPRRTGNWERTRRPDLTPGIIIIDGYKPEEIRKVSLSSAYERMLFTDPRTAQACFRKLAIAKKCLPSLDEFSLELVIDRNFREDFNRLVMQPTRANILLEDIKKDLMPRIAVRYNTELDTGSDPARAFDATIPRFIQSLESELLFTRKDGKIFHIADTRLLPEGHVYARVMKDCVEHLEQDGQYLQYLLYGFAEIVRVAREKPHELTVEERNTLLDWYLIDKRLRDISFSAGAIAELFYKLSQSSDEKEAELALEIYEDHEESFNMIFAEHPQYNYIIEGKAVEYDSLDDFIKSSPETADMFVEAADTGKHGGSGGGRGKRRRREATPEELNHILMVKEAMSNIFDAAQKVGTELHVLNILKNSIRKAGSDLAVPSTTGSYVAVAFKCNGEHWILADTVKLGGGAVYLWHGTSYNEGLEIYKKAHSVARQEASVNTRNHVYARRTLLEIYQDLLKAQGVAL